MELELIIVVDDTARRIRYDIRPLLLEMSIPCIVTDSRHFDRFLPCELIIVTEKYLLDDVTYVASMYGKCDTVCIDEYLPMTDEVMKAITARFGSFFEHSRERVTVSDGNVFYRGRRLYLTPTEMRILNLFLYSDKTYSPEAVAAFCLADVKRCSASTHINRINSKARCAVGLPIIVNKRYKGYTLNQQ